MQNRTGGQSGTSTSTESKSSTSTSSRASEVRSVQLSSEQKTRIHDVVVKDSSARVDHVDFAVTVGTRVPRTVHARTISEDIVRIVPQYRGFMYIIVRNDLLIIDPDTFEIVAVIPV
jgi:hypothetical protein